MQMIGHESKLMDRAVRAMNRNSLKVFQDALAYCADTQLRTHDVAEHWSPPEAAEREEEPSGSIVVAGETEGIPAAR